MNLTTARTALDLDNILAQSWECKAEGLTPAEKRFYRAVLRTFPVLGGSPGPDRVRADAASLALDAEAALNKLEGRDLIVRDPTTGSIIAAYPFSGIPTPHRVELAGARPLYAMCAVDAIGIPFMLERDARIISQAPISEEPVLLQVRGGEVRWEPPGAVVFVGRLDGEGPIAQTCCTVMRFFRSQEAAERYQSGHPDLTGQVLDQDEAVAAARRVFGMLLLNGEPGTPSKTT